MEVYEARQDPHSKGFGILQSLSAASENGLGLGFTGGVRGYIGDIYIYIWAMGYVGDI